MCGIVGGVSFNGEFFPKKGELETASSYLRYRGPDDQGEFFHSNKIANLALAHRRLSIIDLSDGGHQPMVSDSGKSAIVFNGEIYNYKSIKSELQSIGISFCSASDTEVILKSFEQWGIETTLEKLDGMFAFALFDMLKNRMHLARDRFGKKPLYYHAGFKRIAFSSDIRCFQRVSGINLTLDLHSLGYYFAELSTPHENTIWNEIKKLKPGSYLTFDSTGISAYKSYWNLVYTEDCQLSREEILLRTEELFNKAVAKRLVGDVRVSALLSGGIDSSLVVAKMAEAKSDVVKTYSVGFKDDRFNELSYARAVVKRFNTDHTELIVEPSCLAAIHNLISEYGEPFADSSMIPTYLMSKEISKTEKVVLGGDGGDELFGGYHSYYVTSKFDLVKHLRKFMPLAKWLNRMVPTYRTSLLYQLLQKADQPLYRLLNREFGFSESGLKKLLPKETFFRALDKEHRKIWGEYAQGSKSDLINVMSASLKTRLLNDYLVKVDRASMFASLEMRSPFLDKDLAEFAGSLKSSQLFYKTGTKSILKGISEKYFTKDFVHRHKMGFGMPLGDWLKKELAPVLKEVVLGGKQHMVELDYKFIESVIDDHSKGIADHTHRLWSLYVFHIWASNQ